MTQQSILHLVVNWEVFTINQVYNTLNILNICNCHQYGSPILSSSKIVLGA